MDRSNSGVVDTCLFNWRVPKESEKAASEMGTDGLFFVIQGSYYQILHIWKLERMRLRPWRFKHNITVAFLFSSIANLLHLGKCPKMRHANEPTVENAGSCEWRKIQREREREIPRFDCYFLTFFSHRSRRDNITVPGMFRLTFNFFCCIPDTKRWCTRAK